MLSKFYAIDAVSARKGLRDAVAVLKLILSHLERPIPPWLSELAEAACSDVPTEIHQAFNSEQQDTG